MTDDKYAPESVTYRIYRSVFPDRHRCYYCKKVTFCPAELSLRWGDGTTTIRYACMPCVHNEETKNKIRMLVQ